MQSFVPPARRPPPPTAASRSEPRPLPALLWTAAGTRRGFTWWLKAPTLRGPKALPPLPENGFFPARRRRSVVAAAFLAVLAGPGVAVAEPGADPGSPQHRPTVTDVAHRGASAYAPENTLAAMETAADLGAGMAEADVQRTADGELVLMHDTTLERTTDARRVYPERASYHVGDFTLAELRELDAGSWFGSAYAGEPIPTLRETLDRLRELELGFVLEIKASDLYPGIEADIARELHADPWWLEPAPAGQPHRLVVQSFGWDTLERSHRLLPDLPHGLLGRVEESRISEYADWADQINPDFRTVDADYIAAVQAEGMEIYVYTVNDAEDMRARIADGVDGVISDRPDVLLEVIAESTAREAAA